MDIALPNIPGFSIKLWNKVPGKERVYVTLLRKSNGGANWNGGEGRADYLDIATMRWIETRAWAGAATRDKFSSAVATAHRAVEDAVNASRSPAPTIMRRTACPNPRDCGDPTCDGSCGY